MSAGEINNLINCFQKAESRLDTYNGSLKRAAKSLGDDLIPEVETYIAKHPDATTESFANNLRALQTNAQGATVATTALATAMSMLGTMIISMAVAELISLLYKLSQAENEAKNSAKELGEKYKTTADDINQYKEKIKDLHEILNDSNTSYEDSKTAREQLLSIQDELISKYGSEAEAIRNIKLAVDGEIESLDKLSKSKYLEFLNDLNFDEDSLPKKVNRWLKGYKSESDRIVKEMEETPLWANIDGMSYSFLEEIKKRFSNVSGDYFSGLYISGGENGGLEEAYQTLVKIEQLAKDDGQSDFLISNLAKAAKDAKDNLASYQDAYDEIVLNERVFGNEEYENSYQNILNQYEKYRQAFIDQNEVAMQDSINNIAEIMSNTKIDMAGDGINIEEQSIINSFYNAFSNIQDLVKQQEFEIELNVKANKDEFLNLWDSSLWDQAYIDISQMTEKQKEASIYTEQQLQTVANIEEYAKAHNITLDQAIAKAREYNVIRSKSVDNVINILDSHGLSGASIESSIEKELTEKEREIIIEGKIDWDKVKTFDDLKKILSEAQDIADKNTPEIDVKVKSLESIQGLSKGLDQLKNIYQDVANGEEFDFSSLLNNDNFKDAFQDLGTAYTDFINTVTANSDDINACQIAFDNLADAYVRHSEDLKNVTADTKEATIAMLEQDGIANARVLVLQALANAGIQLSTAEQEELNAAKSAALAEYELAEAEAQEWLAKQDTIVLSAERIQSLYSEAEAAGISMQAFISLVSEMIIFNSQGLSVEDKIANLQALAAQAGITSTAISGIMGSSKIARMYKVIEKNAGTEQANIWLSKMNKQLYKQGNVVDDVTAKYKALDKASKGGGGGKSKDTEKEVDILAELSKQLDEIQGAYQNIIEIREQFNETGKISVDQAQSLMNTDLRFLGLLETENGALGVNEQGFQSLAEAKLREMQIQLARNAIDTISKLTDEATAAEYLTYAYHDLADAQKDVVEQQLDMAVAAAKARGVKQGEAAELIRKGYRNASNMLQYVDYSQEGMGYKKKDDDRDKNKDKDKDKEEEKFEKEYNWIERLLNKISDITDKWDKAIERFFSYWNKNFAINQEVKSNRMSILYNERAYTEYMKQANKVNLKQKYIDYIENGDFVALDLVTDKGLSEKIDKYSEWIEKAKSAKDAVAELYDTERKLIRQKLDNILDYYDTIEKYYSSITSKFDALNSVKEASGKRLTLEDLLSSYMASDNELTTVKQKAYEYLIGPSSTREQEEIEKDLQALSTAYGSTDFYKEYKEQEEELLQRRADYEQLQEDIAAKQAQIKEETDKDVKKELQEELKELQAQAKATKLTSNEENLLKLYAKRNDVYSTLITPITEKEYQEALKKIEEIKQEIDSETDQDIKRELQQELFELENQSNSYYQSYYETTKAELSNLLDRQSEYEDLQESITEKQAEIKEETDKDTKKELQNELKELQAQAKKAKLTNNETKLIDEYQKYINSIEQIGDKTLSRYYAQAITKLDELETRRHSADFYADYIVSLQDEIKEETDKDAKKELQTKLSEAKKEYNKVKLSNNDLSLLNSLTQQVEAMKALRETATVGNEVASTAQYQNLLIKIADLQNKKSLSNSDQSNLAMYLSELNAINSGVAANQLEDYIKLYEEWWKLNNKASLSANEKIKLEDLTKQKTAIEKDYQDQIDKLQAELEDSILLEELKGLDLDDLDADQQREILDRNKDKAKKELTNSYNNQISSVKDSYKQTATYKDIYKKYQNELSKSKPNQKNLAEYKAILEAFEQGATDKNITEYKKAWDFVYKNQDKAKQGKLSGKNLTQYDEYVAQLKAWDSAKTTEIQSLQKQLADAIKQLDYEYDTQINQNETEIAEKRQKLWEIAKQVAEYQATSAEAIVNSLQAIINQYVSVARVLETTGLDALRKYDLTSLFGINSTGSVTDALSEQLTAAVSSSEERINKLVEEYNLYQKLVEAGNSSGFKSILENYLTNNNLSDEMYKSVEKLISQLDENIDSDSTWLDEWNDKLSEIMGEITTAITDIQSLKDELRENVLFKAVQNSIDQISILNSELSTMAELVSDKWVRDANGMTIYGKAKVNVLSEQWANAKKQVQNYAELVEAVDRAQSNPDTAYGTEEEYASARYDALQNYYNSLIDLENISNEIYEIGKEQQEQEVEQIKKLTNARKEALTSKREYYEYNKSITNATNEVEALQAQIDALNDVNDAASKAKKAQLESQLKDAKDNLEDIRMQHEFDLEEKALDQFITKLDESLENATQNISETFEDFANVISKTIAEAADADTALAYKNIFDLLMGTNTSSSSAIADEAVPESNINGSSGNLSQYYNNIGSSLQSQASALKPYITSIENYTRKITNTINDSIAPSLKNGGNITINNSYDSLLQVEGSIDATVVDNVKQMLEESYKYTSQKIYTQLKQMGVMRKYY